MAEEGFNETQYISELEQQLQAQQSQINQLSGNANSIFNAASNPNLIVYQLELDNILERIEHLLRGDVIDTDQEGNTVYVEPDDKSLIVLNDYGVKLVMNIISTYLNRNTILSNYSEDRIKKILYNLSIELIDVIYVNYEKMGMDTIEKKSRFPSLVVSIVHAIESSYMRALSGKERESLRSARMVTQNEPLGNQMQRPYNNGRRFKLFSPTTWIK
jgi:hypothetical protein